MEIKKKKIVFCLQTMVRGGVEKELITILKRFDPEDYQITVVLLYITDREIVKQIPEYVRVINLNIDKEYYCGSLASLVTQRIKSGKIREATFLAVSRLFNSGMTHGNVSVCDLPNLSDQYDYAVCYHMHSPLALQYVEKKIQSKKKYVWIHNDFLTTGFQANRLSKILNSFDLFIGVSRRIVDEFVELCPQYADRTKIIYNIVDVEEIRRKAEDYSVVIEKSFLGNENLKILSIGRLVKQKGFDLAIRAADYLKKQGYNFTWYIIGTGKEEETLKEQIKFFDLETNFVLLGGKDNPYPYIKLSDVYIQPSRHEGYPISILEAKALSKFVVCTNFAGADEIIQDGEDGIITLDLSPESIAEGIIRLMSGKENFKNNYIFSENDNGWKMIQSIFDDEI